MLKTGANKDSLSYMPVFLNPLVSIPPKSKRESKVDLAEPCLRNRGVATSLFVLNTFNSELIVSCPASSEVHIVVTVAAHIVELEIRQGAKSG